jgi:hypothetical protein
MVEFIHRKEQRVWRPRVTEDKSGFVDNAIETKQYVRRCQIRKGRRFESCHAAYVWGVAQLVRAVLYKARRVQFLPYIPM